MTTWNALIVALLLFTFATGCGRDHAQGPAGPTNDSILGHDLALAPLNYVDAAGRVYELLLAVDSTGMLAAACFIVDGALFATVVPSPTGPQTDVQIYQNDRAVFRAVVTPSVVDMPDGPWPAFTAATAETRTTLAAWQRSASGVRLARVHVALDRLVSAAVELLSPSSRDRR